MTIETLSVGPLEVNAYIIFNENMGQALLVDPGDEAERILGRLRALKLSLTAVLLTHGHLDHWAAVPKINDMRTVPVYLHQADLFLLNHSVNKDLAKTLGWELPNLMTIPLVEGPNDMAGISFDVIHTPGHTPGSVVFKFEDRLLTGDTLFAGGIGRTDLPGGNGKALYASLAKLRAFPSHLRVYPGHGELSDLAHEQRFNPFW